MALNNIYSNNFYDKQPIPLWSFAVSFDIKTPSLSTLELERLSKAAQNCAYSERTVNTQQVFCQGFVREVPTMAKMDGVLTIKFNENEDLEITRILRKIYKYSYNDLATQQDFFGEDGDSPTYEYRYPKFQPFDVALKIYKPDDAGLYIDSGDLSDDFLLKVVYHNCMITKMGQVEFDYTNGSDVMKLDVDIHYDWMEEMNV